MEKPIEVIISGPNSATAIRAKTIKELPRCLEHCIRLFNDSEEEPFLHLKIVLEMACSYLADEIQGVEEVYQEGEEIVTLISDMQTAAEKAKSLFHAADRKQQEEAKASRTAWNKALANALQKPNNIVSTIFHDESL